MAFNFNPLLRKINEIDALLRTNWNGDEGLYKRLSLLKPLCENRLNNVYADLAVQHEINELQNYLNALAINVQAYKSGNTSLTDYITGNIDYVVQTILRIPFAGKDETAVTLTTIIDDFSQKKDELANEIDTLKQTIDTLSKELTRKSTEVTNLTTKFQEQFSDAQDKRSNAFTDAQDKHNNVFAETQKKHEEQFINKEKERDTQFDTQINEFSASAASTLKETSGIKEKVEEIYGAIGKSSIVGTQKNYADKAKTMANWLQFASIILMLAAIGVLVFLLHGELKDISLSNFLYRFSIGGIFMLPAFFLANEGKRQRDKENMYRELEIKMAAITPYFLEISDGASRDNEQLPEKDRVKLELAQKLLAPSKQKSDKSVVLPPDMLELIKSLMEIVKK
jgi:archaellum component FlaC